MRTFREIRKQSKKGDIQRVSEIVGCSYELVKKVVNEEKPDHKNIQEAFDKYLEQRRQLELEYRERNGVAA